MKLHFSKWNVLRLTLILASSILPCTLALIAQADDSADLTALVEALASPNPQPKLKGDGSDRLSLVLPHGQKQLPAEFDKNAQVKVVEAWDALLVKGTPAFPYLFKLFDDNRYSTSIASVISEDWQNATVGWVCKEIVQSQIEPWGQFARGKAKDPRSRLARPSYCFNHLQTTKQATEWWQSHQKQTLREIQIEALEWIIAKENKENAVGYAEDLTALRAWLKELTKSEQPRKPSKVGYSAIYRLGGYEGG